MGLGKEERLRAVFVQIARVGLDLFHSHAPSFEEGLSLARARRLLDESRARLAEKGPVKDSSEWVRSEAEAGLHWIFESPRVAPGLYVCVDVGAGTTDVSAFSIVERFEDGFWVKGKLAFYSAVSSRPGVDAIDSVILKAIGEIRDVRTRENQLIAERGLTDHRDLNRILGEIHETYRRAWVGGYKILKERLQWENFGLFTLGGGCKIDSVVSALEKTPWEGQLKDRVPKVNEFPGDLFEMPSGKGDQLKPFQGDAVFLLVAYGLSFMSGDVPVAETPDQMSVFEPLKERKRIDQDDYYGS